MWRFFRTRLGCVARHTAYTSFVPWWPKLTEGPTGDLSEAAIREAAEVYVRGGLLRRHVPGDTLTGLRRARSAGLFAGRRMSILTSA